MNATEAMKESLRRYPKDFLQRIAKHPVENYLNGSQACGAYILERCA